MQQCCSSMPTIVLQQGSIDNLKSTAVRNEIVHAHSAYTVRVVVLRGGWQAYTVIRYMFTNQLRQAARVAILCNSRYSPEGGSVGVVLVIGTACGLWLLACCCLLPTSCWLSLLLVVADCQCSAQGLLASTGCLTTSLVHAPFKVNRARSVFGPVMWSLFHQPPSAWLNRPTPEAVIVRSALRCQSHHRLHWFHSQVSPPPPPPPAPVQQHNTPLQPSKTQQAPSHPPAPTAAAGAGCGVRGPHNGVRGPHNGVRIGYAAALASTV